MGSVATSATATPAATKRQGDGRDEASAAGEMLRTNGM
jgi:hypothetical protein